MSIDGHVKICLGIDGQVSPHEAAKRPAISDCAHLRTILTIRGRTGPVLGVQLAPSESTNHVAKVLVELFTVAQRAEVHKVCLKTLALDIVHRAMN